MCPEDRDIIDQILAHVTRNQIKAAYNRAEYRDRKRELAQEWADMVLEGVSVAASLLKRSKCFIKVPMRITTRAYLQLQCFYSAYDGNKESVQ